jgi:hypothetical protein
MKKSMSKGSKIIKRLKEETEYQTFFKKAMDKFKISTPADLKDPVRKKEFFDYIDKNYKAKDEMSENTYQMSNPAVKTKVEMVINTLKEIEVDGETMEYILDEVGISDQMASQLSDKVDDEGFPYMSGGRP